MLSKIAGLKEVFLLIFFSTLYGTLLSQPVFTSSPVTAAQYGEAYSYQITITDDPAPVNTTFSLVSGAPGLSLRTIDADQAVLEGNPAQAGIYSITVRVTNNDDGEFSEQDFELDISKAPATIGLSALNQEFSDAPLSVSYTTQPPGLNVILTYDGSTSLPVNAGSYAVEATIDETNYSGSTQATMVISKASAQVSLSDLNQNYDGNPKAVSVTTVPEGLNFDVTYDGSANLPVEAGTYEVVATIAEQNYTGQATGQLFINNPPFASPIPNVTVNEDAPNSSVTLTSYFDDDEDGSNNLDYSIVSNTNAPLFSAVSINASNVLILSYGPDMNGTAQITVRATDSGGLSAESTLNVTVNPQPDAPEFVSTPITGGVQGQEYVYNIEVEDPDANETLTYTTALPGWLTFEDLGDGMARLSGTPGNAEVGSHVVALEVIDSDGLKDTQFFNITVENSNDPPVFTSIPIQSATENVTYTYNITTSDPDNDNRTITALEIPGWLTLTDNGNGTARLSGVPGNNDGGANQVRIQVADIFGATAVQAFTIEVVNTNNPPSFTSNPVTTVNEDQNYTYNVVAQDPDGGDVLTINLLAGPAWMTISSTGNGRSVLSGTPANKDVGTSNVVLSVTDAEGAQANQNFTVTVRNVNDAPRFTSEPVVAALQGAEYIYDITTSDPDAGDTRTITASQKPAWLSITDNGNGTARLRGVPGNEDFGSNPVTIVVRDNAGASDTQSFTINVDNVNDQPVFTSTPITNAIEDVRYTYNIRTSDPDEGDSREITGLALPQWLQLTDNGDGTAVLQGTPRNAQVGNHSIVLNVRDALGANTNQNFTITVQNSNDPPVFISTPVTSALQDVEYRYEIRTNDVDANDALTISAETLPGWLTFTDLGNGNGLLTGVPANVNLGANPVKLSVTDLAGSTAFQNFTIVVDNTNDAPFFTSTPVTSVAEDATYRYNITTSDPDGGDILTIRAVAFPGWLSFTDNGDGTAVIQGIPRNANVGSVSVVLTVEDAQGLIATQNFEINVINTNDPPVFASSPVTAAIQNINYNYSILTTDPDAGDSRTISSIQLPGWLTLTDLGNGSAELRGTPSNQNLGANPVILRVTDEAGAATDQSFTINVDNVNDPPAFTSNPQTEVNEDVRYEYLVTTSDPDNGDSRSITAFSLPEWLELTDNGDGTAVLEGTPENKDVGTHPVILNVRDGLGANANQSFSIIVQNTNDAPFFSSQPVPVAVQNANYSYSITTDDPDQNDVLTLEVITMPSWLQFTSTGEGGGTLTGTPGNNDLGKHEVILEVTDREGAASQQIFSINVDNANDPPEFTSTPITTALEDNLYEYLITTSDPDQGDIRKIEALSIPGWLTLTDNGDGTGVLRGTPANSDVGNASIVLRVEDALGSSDDQSFQLQVINTNDAPVFTSQPVLGAIQSASYVYNINTQDADAGDTRTIALVQGPSWLSLSDNGNGTAVLSGTPGNNDLGLADVVIEVTDAAGAATRQVFQINVDNQNDAPVFSSNPVVTVNQDDPYQYLINTTDADINDTRRIVALTLPGWLSIEDLGDGTAILSGLPGNDEVGSHSVVLEVTDALGAKDTQSFSVQVININDAPRFTSDPVNVARVGQAYRYDIEVTDVDANATLSVSAAGLPSWLSLGSLVNNVAALSGTPSAANVNREFEITIVVTDEGGLKSEQQFTLRVEYPNNPPTIQPVADVTGVPEDSDPIEIRLSGIGPGNNENQQITISATSSLPALFSSIDIDYSSPASNGLLTLTPAPNAFGTAEIIIVVKDDGDVNLNETTISFTVQILSVNDVPEFTSQPVSKVSPGESYAYNITADDADEGDVLRITAPQKPGWVTFADNGDGTALLQGTVPDNVTPAAVRLRVTDSGGKFSEQTFTLQVNRRPQLSDVTINTSEDVDYSFSLEDFLKGYVDVNGDAPAHIRIVDLPEHGSLSYQGSAVAPGQLLVPSAGVLDGLVYEPVENFNGSDQFRWNISDGEVEAASPAFMYMEVEAVNDPPIISNLESGAISYSQGQGEIYVTQTVTVTDIDNNQIAGARVAIESNYVRGEDVLLYQNELTPAIAASFDAEKGEMVFTGLSSKSEYDIALNNVRYINNVVGDVDFTSKSISFYASDETEEGPPSTRSLRITEVFPELDLVNAFTPNNDGVNDVWDIGNLSAYRNAMLTIFDGNGNEIYSCFGTDCTWDGKRGGRNLPSGPYYYVISLNDGQQVYRGTVSILK